MLNVPGIGAKGAEKLVSALGLELEAVLGLEHAAAVARMVGAGVGTKAVCATLKRKWDAAQGACGRVGGLCAGARGARAVAHAAPSSRCTAAANQQGGFLGDLGLRPQDCAAAEELYGADCKAVFTADPYVALMRLPSINFSLRCAGAGRARQRAAGVHGAVGSQRAVGEDVAWARQWAGAPLACLARAPAVRGRARVAAAGTGTHAAAHARPPGARALLCTLAARSGTCPCMP